MPRVARLYLDEAIYHIMSRGNNRQWVFDEEKDFEKYTDILRRYKGK